MAVCELGKGAGADVCELGEAILGDSGRPADSAEEQQAEGGIIERPCVMAGNGDKDAGTVILPGPDQRSFNAAALRLVDDLQEQVDRLQGEVERLRSERAPSA